MMAPDTTPLVPRTEFGAFWPFHPSFETNLCIAMLFGFSTGVHLLQAVLHRTGFCWVIIMGGLWETFAFVLRTLGSQNGTVPVYYIISLVLFNLAPLWINAFLYTMAARLIFYCLQDHKLFNIHATMLAKIFVCLDIVCFLGQAGGGAVMQKSSESEEPERMLKLGHGIYIFGCVVQLCFLALFAVLMIAFRRKLNRQRCSIDGPHRVVFLEAVIYMFLLLITIRVAYRLIELGQGTGHDNPIISNEIYAIVLDAVQMILAFLLLNAAHPGVVMRGADSNFGRGGKHELLQDQDQPTSRSRLAPLRDLLEAWRYNYDLELRDLRR